MSARQLFYVILGAILSAALIIGVVLETKRAHDRQTQAIEEAQKVLR